MRYASAFCLILISGFSATAQEVALAQYSFYCESNSIVDDKYLQERVKSISRIDSGNWRIEAIIFDECNVLLYPEVQMHRDTLVVTTFTVEKHELELSNGKKIIEYSSPEECDCAYELKLELQAEQISHVKV